MIIVQCHRLENEDFPFEICKFTKKEDFAFEICKMNILMNVKCVSDFKIC